jgi:hypothetical protein
VDLTLARLAVVMDDDDAAHRHFEDAVRVHDRAGARPWLARTLAEQGRWLRRRGSPLAGTRLARARTVAVSVGSGRVLELLDR